MAITDNTFTDAELIAAIDANPAVAATVKTALGAKKYVVQDENEHTEFLKNYENTEYKKKVIGEHTSEFASKLEKDVEELTGLKKANPDEKYYDYMKRAVSEKLGTVKQMETELEKLKAGHSPSEEDKARIKKLEDAIEETNNTWKQKYEAKEKEFSTARSAAVVNTALVGVRQLYKQGLPESLVKRTEKSIADEVISRVRIQEDGTETVVDDKGEVILDKTTYKPVTVDEYLKSQLGDMIDTGRQGAGTGTDKNDPGKGGASGKFTGVPSNVTTQVELTEHLQKLGIMAGTPEFDKIFEEHGKNLKLR